MVGADVVKTVAIGDNQGPELEPTIDSDDPGINPTKPKSEVAPLVRPLDADVTPITDRGDFYSPILANLDNLPIGKDGMLGSNIIKFLTKKASNINKTELNWSQLLFPGELNKMLILQIQHYLCKIEEELLLIKYLLHIKMLM